jgi:hypothetical protein
LLARASINFAVSQKFPGFSKFLHLVHPRLCHSQCTSVTLDEERSIIFLGRRTKFTHFKNLITKWCSPWYCCFTINNIGYYLLIGAGGALTQQWEFEVIQYVCRSLREAEQRYSKGEKGLASI